MQRALRGTATGLALQTPLPTPRLPRQAALSSSKDIMPVVLLQAPAASLHETLEGAL